MRHFYTTRIGCFPQYFTGSHVHCNHYRGSTRSQNRFISIDHWALAGKPKWDFRLVLLNHIEPPNQVAGFAFDTHHVAARSNRQYIFRSYGRHCARHSMISFDAQFIRTSPKLLAIFERKAPQSIFALGLIIIHQINPSFVNGWSGMAFAQFNRPLYFWLIARP